ncbi:MAG: hypothetical protein H7Y88_07410 [Phycisphaerales bacterium]|nr:hypothetical protein [Phycisphaerales bacterium]
MKRLLTIVPLVGLAAIAGCHYDDDDDGDGNEVAVTMTDLPAAVRATLDRESVGGNVTEVDREMHGNQTIYSADMTMNGEDWELEIAADGSLVSKQRETDDDDDNGEDDDGNDD